MHANRVHIEGMVNLRVFDEVICYRNIEFFFNTNLSFLYLHTKRNQYCVTLSKC